MIGGEGKSVFRRVLAFPSNVSNRSPLLDLIGGIGSIIVFLVYFIALNIDFGSSFSRKVF